MVRSMRLNPAGGHVSGDVSWVYSGRQMAGRVEGGGGCRRAGRPGAVSDEPEVASAGGGFETGLHAELAEDIVEMALDGADGDDELLGNRAVRTPLHQQPQHL